MLQTISHHLHGTSIQACHTETASKHGTAEIFRYKQNELLKWAAKIARWYVGKSNAKAYGKINSTEGAILARIKPKKIIAEKDIAAWE